MYVDFYIHLSVSKDISFCFVYLYKLVAEREGASGVESGGGGGALRARVHRCRRRLAARCGRGCSCCAAWRGRTGRLGRRTTGATGAAGRPTAQTFWFTGRATLPTHSLYWRHVLSVHTPSPLAPGSPAAQYARSDIGQLWTKPERMNVLQYLLNNSAILCVKAVE